MFQQGGLLATCKDICRLGEAKLRSPSWKGSWRGPKENTLRCCPLGVSGYHFTIGYDLNFWTPGRITKRTMLGSFKGKLVAKLWYIKWEIDFLSVVMIYLAWPFRCDDSSAFYSRASSLLTVPFIDQGQWSSRSLLSLSFSMLAFVVLPPVLLSTPLN